MLDEKDKIIIEYLMHDCRITNTKLAKILKISRPAVSVRIKRLEEEGYILRYDCFLNFNKFKLNIENFFVQIPSNKTNEFESKMTKNKGVISLLKNVNHFNYVVTTFANKNEIKEIFNFLEKNNFRYKYYKAIDVQFPAFSLFGININYKYPIFSNDIIKLDENDSKILERLQNGGGRDSILELSNNTGLAYDLVLYRFKKLKKAGYLTLFIAQPNIKKFHLKVIVIIFKTKNISKDDFVKHMHRISRAIVFYDFGDGVFLNTIAVSSLQDYEEVLSKYYSYLDDKLIDVEIYSTKETLFLNRFDLKKIIEK